MYVCESRGAMINVKVDRCVSHTQLQKKEKKQRFHILKQLTEINYKIKTIWFLFRFCLVLMVHKSICKLKLICQTGWAANTQCYATRWHYIDRFALRLNHKFIPWATIHYYYTTKWRPWDIWFDWDRNFDSESESRQKPPLKYACF